MHAISWTFWKSSWKRILGKRTQYNPDWNVLIEDRVEVQYLVLTVTNNCIQWVKKYVKIF
jgi:hypothetical protein